MALRPSVDRDPNGFGTGKQRSEGGGLVDINWKSILPSTSPYKGAPLGNTYERPRETGVGAPNFLSGVGSFLGSVGNNVGSFLGDVNKNLWDLANTEADNKLNFWKGVFGQNNNSVVDNPATAGNDQPGGSRARAGGGSFGPATPTDPSAGLNLGPTLGYGDFIQQAQDLLAKYGLGDGGVNYDSYRNSARSQWADADARTAAMYRQLQNSISGDEAGIKQNYGAAVTANDQRTQDAGQAIQNAYDQAASESARQAQALGIQEAVANEINNGNFGALDKADAVSDTVQRGQIADTQYGQNQTSAVDANRTTAQAAGLAGANTRALRQNELSKILAQIDTSEQQANANARNGRNQTILGLANQLFGNSTETQQYQDAQQQAAIQAAQNQQKIDQNAPKQYLSPDQADQAIKQLFSNGDPNFKMSFTDPAMIEAYRKFFATLTGLRV